jgi:hypothetical protein
MCGVIKLIAAFLVFVASLPVAAQVSKNYSGICAGIINTSNIYSALIENNNKSIDRESNSLAIRIDFDTMVIEGINSSFIYNGIENSTLIQNSSTTFVITDSKLMTGAKSIKFSISDKYPTELTLISVNSGNTFLIQGVNLSVSGVCQKI